MGTTHILGIRRQHFEWALSVKFASGIDRKVLTYPLLFCALQSWQSAYVAKSG
jgi:hypothetical protein